MIGYMTIGLSNFYICLTDKQWLYIIRDNMNQVNRRNFLRLAGAGAAAAAAAPVAQALGTTSSTSSRH